MRNVLVYKKFHILSADIVIPDCDIRKSGQ